MSIRLNAVRTPQVEDAFFWCGIMLSAGVFCLSLGLTYVSGLEP